MVEINKILLDRIFYLSYLQNYHSHKPYSCFTMFKNTKNFIHKTLYMLVYIFTNMYQPNFLVTKQISINYTLYVSGSKNFISTIIGIVYGYQKKNNCYGTNSTSNRYILDTYVYVMVIVFIASLMCFLDRCIPTIKIYNVQPCN